MSQHIRVKSIARKKVPRKDFKKKRAGHFCPTLCLYGLLLVYALSLSLAYSLDVNVCNIEILLALRLRKSLHAQGNLVAVYVEIDDLRLDLLANLENV